MVQIVVDEHLVDPKFDQLCQLYFCGDIRGLNEIIVLCCEYGKKIDITFNLKTTAYMH